MSRCSEAAAGGEALCPAEGGVARRKLGSKEDVREFEGRERSGWVGEGVALRNARSK